MADNGIYSDGFADGRADLLNELADMFTNDAVDAEHFGDMVEELLKAEGAL